MKRLIALFGCALVAGLLGCSNGNKVANAEPPPVPRAQAGEYQISGPYTHENLSIFVIHGQEQLKGKTYLTLGEAMEQKKVIVHETGNVQQLAIENISDEEVYVQSGDIVKGGRQDRTIATDLVVSAKSGQIPVASFCVESGRWSGRGKEDARCFSSSNSYVGSSTVNFAAKCYNQNDVWKNVAGQQAQLTSNTAVNVQSTTSPSSYQLTLENPKVQETTDAYVASLKNVIEKHPDAVGYAFAINGKVINADVYSSRELFTKLWPKLLRATCVEALAELKKNDKYEPAKPEDVKTTIADASAGKSTEKSVTPRVNLVTREAEKCVLFETYDKDRDNTYVHRNYVTREKAPATQPK